MKSTQEYQIYSAIISAEREFRTGGTDFPGGNQVDLKRMISEINLFEDIYKPYITAQVVVYDDVGLLTEILEVQGREYLELDIRGAEPQFTEGETLKVKMRVVSIIRQKRVNDKVVVFSLNCISEHAYADALVKLSRSYTGQMEDIANNVVEDYLDIETLRLEQYYEPGMESTQGRRKVIVPYMSPLETAEWLTSRCTTDKGMPFFLWENLAARTFFDESKLFLGNFDQMVSKGSEVADGEESLQYFHSQIGTDLKVTAKNNASKIMSFVADNFENTLGMINIGTVGSEINSFDTYTTTRYKRHFDLDKYIERQITPALGGDLTFRTIYDGEDQITINKETRMPSEFDGRYNDTLTSYGTYEWEKGYHDVSAPVEVYAKLTNRAMKSILAKNQMEVHLPGGNFLKDKIGVGLVIKLYFESSNSNTPATKGDLDERLSGYYLIMSARHVFAQNRHGVVVGASKVKDLKEGDNSLYR